MRSKGFTLIELVITISIIGMLLVVFIPAFDGDADRVTKDNPMRYRDGEVVCTKLTKQRVMIINVVKIGRMYNTRFENNETHFMNEQELERCL